MNPPCHDCPHLKKSEGGCNDEDKALEGMGKFKNTAHPCHNNPVTPCRGHLRDLEMVAAGTATLSGDMVRNTYDLRGLDGKIITSGEFTHEEIKALKEKYGIP